MKTRIWSSSTYRFGFQGQEMDDELKGEDNSLNYKFRVHDTRLGRFFAVDPLLSKFAYNSPYAFSENRVIDGIELEGKEVLLIGGNMTSSAGVSVSAEIGIIIDKNGALFLYGSGSLGAATEANIAVYVSITFFPTMPSFIDATGWGGSAGVGYGTGLQGSSSIVVSSGYVGYNQKVGVGASAKLLGGLVSGEAAVSYTSFKPLNEEAKKAMIPLLWDAYYSMNTDIIDLDSKNQGLKIDNTNLEGEIYNIKSKLDQGANQSGALSDKEKERYRNDIQTKQDQIKANNESIKKNEKNIGEITDERKMVQMAIEKITGN